MRQIQREARNSPSLDDLRGHFDRIQEIRRSHINEFDVQVLLSEVQEEIIERARFLRSSSQISDENGMARQVSYPAVSSPSRPLDEPSDAAEIPPEVPRLDKKTWQRSLFLALFLTAVVLAAFFYLIQTARRINLPQPAPIAVTQPPAKTPPTQNPAPQPVAAAPLAPMLRLYTDLVPGTVSVDNAEPQPLKDGELQLDHLTAGQHSIKLTGSSGSAAFTFKVEGNSAPEVTGSPTVSNAVAVLVWAQDGKGRLISSAEDSTLLLDGKPAGDVDPDGLALENLGTGDHDLQVNHNKQRQRFIWTYTAAPVLTVYIKSDPNTGMAVVMTHLDGVSIFIDNKPYRRQTEGGQLRMPLKVGEYTIRVHKDGFIDPPPQSVEVKKAEEAAVQFSLEPIPAVASLMVKGAQPGTGIYIDKDLAATVGPTGAVNIPNVKPGEHSIELRRDQFSSKTVARAFQPNKAVTLSGDDVTLEPAPTENASAKPAPAEAIPAISQPAATENVVIPGEQIRKGGGFVPYHVPHAPGRYSFEAHGRIGGFLKHSKLQWYAGYEDSDNYILFTLDGKHAIVREIRDGKSVEVNRIPFDADSNQWVQVDVAVKPGSIAARVKTTDGIWNDIGAVTTQSRDFTQGKVGFYIPGNDEVAVANFRFTNQ